MTSTIDDLFLPEPEPREVRYTVVSVDDHLVEPPHMFEGRLPAHLQERAPRIIEDAEGHQSWKFDGAEYNQVGMNAIAGRRIEGPNFNSSASTRCARDVGTSRARSATWTSMKYGLR